MRRLLAAVLIILTLAPALAVHAADANAEARYQALLAAAKAGQPIDWGALRFAYADSAEFDVTGARSDTARKAMFQAINSGDYKGAIDQAQIILDQDYADIDAHVVMNLALEQTGTAAQAKAEHDIVVALLHSIRTGDGATPAGAFTVITVGEEYAMIRAFAMKVTHQALVRQDGHSYDKLDVADDQGKPLTFYFLVDRVLAAEAAATKGQ